MAKFNQDRCCTGKTGAVSKREIQIFCPQAETEYDQLRKPEAAWFRYCSQTVAANFYTRWRISGGLLVSFFLLHRILF